MRPSKRWLFPAGVATILALTLSLWLAGVITSAAALTAYATTALAVGTVGLAAGAIGTYRQQLREATARERQLEAAKEDDIARVIVERTSAPGEFLVADVTNNSSRAIRSVYVWADVDGMTGHYHAAVFEIDPQPGQEIASRRMPVLSHHPERRRAVPPLPRHPTRRAQDVRAGPAHKSRDRHQRG